MSLKLETRFHDFWLFNPLSGLKKWFVPELSLGEPAQENRRSWRERGAVPAVAHTADLSNHPEIKSAYSSFTLTCTHKKLGFGVIDRPIKESKNCKFLEYNRRKLSIQQQKYYNLTLWIFIYNLFSISDINNERLSYFLTDVRDGDSIRNKQGRVT